MGGFEAADGLDADAVVLEVSVLFYDLFVDLWGDVEDGLEVEVIAETLQFLLFFSLEAS